MPLGLDVTVPDPIPVTVTGQIDREQVERRTRSSHPIANRRASQLELAEVELTRWTRRKRCSGDPGQTGQRNLPRKLTPCFATV